MGRFLVAVAILGFLFLAQHAYAAAPRVALVVGNSAYANAPLANPANDARLIAETLRGLGFDVIERIDANLEEIQLATFELQDRLFAAGKDAVGLFYYAGHGVQVSGQNYLIPLNSNIEKEREVAIKAVSAGFVLKQMEFARNRMNFVILDACRNNPLSRSFRSASRGLARMDAPRGSLVAYSTGPGDVAADGTGINSPYTLALARIMQMPGVPAEKMFKLVRNSVMEVSNGEQTPWEESSLTGDDFYFVVAPPVTAEASAEPLTLDKAEQAFWQAIEDSDNASDYRAYLRTYPTGIYMALAEARAATHETERLAMAQDDTAEEANHSTTNQAEIEMAFWNSIKSSSNAADYTAYLDAYPNGSFTLLARARLSSIESAGQAEAAEMALWQSVEASGMAEDYQTYINAYPLGNFAEVARVKVHTLAQSQRQSDAGSTEVASLNTQVMPTPETEEGPVNYNGDWILEIADTNNLSSGDRVEIQIIGREFSLGFSAAGWKGTLHGKIDEMGNLSGAGRARYKSSDGGDFQFSAQYVDGLFGTGARLNGREGKNIDFVITLTRATP